MDLIEQSQLIVQGQLQPDGRVVIERVWHGTAPQNPFIRVVDADVTYVELAEAMHHGGDIPVVAFLRERTAAGWQPAPYKFGFVGLGDNVAFNPRGYSIDSGYPRYNTYNERRPFLTQLEVALSAVQRLHSLVDQPCSAARARQLMQFALANWEDYPMVLRVLKGGTDEEMRAIVQWMPTLSASQLVYAISLSQFILPSHMVYETMLPYAARQRPVEVQRAALNAIFNSDPRRAETYLRSRLNIDEPAWPEIIRNIRPIDNQQNFGFLSIETAAAIHKLGLAVRRQQMQSATPKPANTALLEGCGVYGHPHLVALLTEFTALEGPAATPYAGWVLANLTGLKQQETDRAGWAAWWKGAAPLLTVDYNLATPRGLKQWCIAYQQADSGTQRILMRLWRYERHIDYWAVWRATDQWPDLVPALHAALAQFWSAERLPPPVQQQIAARHMHFWLEPWNPALYGGQQPVRVRERHDFPIPSSAGVSTRSFLATRIPRASRQLPSATSLIARNWGHLRDCDVWMGTIDARQAPEAKARYYIIELTGMQGRNAVWIQQFAVPLTAENIKYREPAAPR